MDLKSVMINMIADHCGLSSSRWLNDTSSRKMYCSYLRGLSHELFIWEFEEMRKKIQKHEEFMDE